jgi:Protein of unknown function (DUF3102)
MPKISARTKSKVPATGPRKPVANGKSATNGKPVPPAKTQEEPIAEIKRLYGEIVGAMRMSLPKAVRIGELLTEQKKTLKHGEWQCWLKENCPAVTPRTATNYMSLWNRQDQLKLKSENVSDLNLSQAYHILTKPEPKKGRGNSKKNDDADEPTKERIVPVQFKNEEDAAEFNKLLHDLTEKVFTVSDPSVALLRALKFTKDNYAKVNGRSGNAA